MSIFFSNITTWGQISQNWLLSESVLNKFSLFGLVETHAGQASDPHFSARFGAHGFTSCTCPAMAYPQTGGNHGGEAIVTANHLYANPIDDGIIERAAHVNDEPRRWTATEVRVSKVSMIIVTAYLWCGEGLSQRNWAIL